MITLGGTIDQHHCVKAADLSLFEAIRKGLGLLQCDLKMLLSGFPLACGPGGRARDGLRKAGDRPKRYCSRVHQLTNQRVEPSRLRSLAQDDEALNDLREHQPRSSSIGVAAK